MERRPTALPRIESRLTCLRPLASADASALLETWGEPRVMAYMSRPPLVDEAAARAFIQEIDECVKAGTLHQWGIERRADRALVGTATLAGLDWINRRAEVGFAIAPDYWRQGLISDALPALLDHAFGPLGLHRIDADVDPENVASLKLLQTLGFEREGYLRQCYQVHGKLQDAVLLGLLAPDWRTRCNG